MVPGGGPRRARPVRQSFRWDPWPGATRASSPCWTGRHSHRLRDAPHSRYRRRPSRCLIRSDSLMAWNRQGHPDELASQRPQTHRTGGTHRRHRRGRRPRLMVRLRPEWRRRASPVRPVLRRQGASAATPERCPGPRQKQHRPPARPPVQGRRQGAGPRARSTWSRIGGVADCVPGARTASVRPVVQNPEPCHPSYFLRVHAAFRPPGPLLA